MRSRRQECCVANDKNQIFKLSHDRRSYNRTTSGVWRGNDSNKIDTENIGLCTGYASHTHKAIVVKDDGIECLSKSVPIHLLHRTDPSVVRLRYAYYFRSSVAATEFVESKPNRNIIYPLFSLASVDVFLFSIRRSNCTFTIHTHSQANAHECGAVAHDAHHISACICQTTVDRLMRFSNFITIIAASAWNKNKSQANCVVVRGVREERKEKKQQRLTGEMMEWKWNKWKQNVRMHKMKHILMRSLCVDCMDWCGCGCGGVCLQCKRLGESWPQVHTVFFLRSLSLSLLGFLSLSTERIYFSMNGLECISVSNVLFSFSTCFV